MPFYINHSDGSSLATVQDGTVDVTSTSIGLIGKNFPTYGTYVNQNFIALLENSANTSPPDPAQIGQLWFDKTNKAIKVYRSGSTSNNWQKIAVSTESDTEPTDPVSGDLWWDKNNSQLKIYDTTISTWRIIGPQTTTNGRLAVTGNSGFQLVIGGNPYFLIDTTGAVNLPNNPCVVGYDNVSLSNLTSTGISYFNTWIPNIKVDRGNNFNKTTGVFTVNTAGLYRVYAHVTALIGTSAGTINLRWRVNNSEVNINATSNIWSASLAGQTRQIVCSGIISANAGDSIRLVYATELDSTNQISYQNSSYTIQLVG